MVSCSPGGKDAAEKCPAKNKPIAEQQPNIQQKKDQIVFHTRLLYLYKHKRDHQVAVSLTLQCAHTTGSLPCAFTPKSQLRDDGRTSCPAGRRYSPTMKGYSE